MIRGYLFNGLRSATGLWLRQYTEHLRSFQAARERQLSNGDVPCGRVSQSYRRWLWSVALLHGSDCARIERTRSLNPSNADGLWASKLKHTVQSMNGDSDLGRAALFRPRAQRIADHSFEAADGGLDSLNTIDKSV
jgi:hypothetical protein